MPLKPASTSSRIGTPTTCHERPVRCGARGAHAWDGQCHDLEDVILRAGRPEHAVEIEAAWPLGLIRREDLEQPESGVSANAMRLMCTSQFGATARAGPGLSPGLWGAHRWIRACRRIQRRRRRWPPTVEAVEGAHRPSHAAASVSQRKGRCDACDAVDTPPRRRMGTCISAGTAWSFSLPSLSFASLPSFLSGRGALP